MQRQSPSRSLSRPISPVSIESIVASPKLPSLPAVAVRIIGLIQDPDVSLAILADAISSDPGLTGKILRQANSSVYGRTRGVSKLTEALMVLGLRRAKTLALGFSLVDEKRGDVGGFDYTAFWNRSLFAAVGARLVALRVGGVDEEEAFLGGLMHGLGVLALNNALGSDYQALFDQADGDYAELLALESGLLGVNHAQLGGALGEHWELPRGLTAALQLFPTPELADEAFRPMVSCVSLGSAAADVFTREDRTHAVLHYRDRGYQLFNSAPSESDQMLPRIQSEAAGMQALLNLAGDEVINIGEILSQANEALVALSSEAETENVRLEHRNTQLSIEAYTDAPTGLANRRQLEKFIEESIEVALAERAPLCYLMVDIDHFKRVNDLHGHPAGDIVLNELAKTLVAAARTDDLVARYGGEEFGVVAPHTDLRSAVQLAQRIRSAVESREFCIPPSTQLKVTVSIGVAVFDPSWPSPVLQLIAAADEALYQAKESGRNAVRIAA